MAWLALLLSFLVGAIACARTRRLGWSWLLSCGVMPVFVLLAEAMPAASEGGASMWPVALAFGGMLGALAGGAGVLLADWLQRRRG